MDRPCPITARRCHAGHVNLWRNARPYHTCRSGVLPFPSTCGLVLSAVPLVEREAISTAYALGGEQAVVTMYPDATLVDGTSWSSKWRQVGARKLFT